MFELYYKGSLSRILIIIIFVVVFILFEWY